MQVELISYLMSIKKLIKECDVSEVFVIFLS